MSASARPGAVDAFVDRFDVAEGAAQLSGETVARRLETDTSSGLTLEQTSARLVEFGPNELEPARKTSIWRLFWDGAREPFVVLLFVAGCLAIALGEVRDGLLVLVILAPIVGAGVVTEYRGERALEALREAAAPSARVRRGGIVEDVPTSALVPGDVVLLRTGDVVPADLRLIRADGMSFDRSALTGESLPERASVEPDPAGAALAECHSVGYAGTAVVGGRGEGVVVATGARTQFGRISQALASRERRRSPLQREMDRLVRILLFVAIGLIAIVVGLGFARGNEAGKNILAGISAAIAAIPEEPPALVAVVLGLGAYRLLRMKVTVRRLSAQETLGSIDLIVTDKTGTLTENRLALVAIRTPEGIVEDPERVAELATMAIRAEEDAWSVATGSKPGSFSRSLYDFLRSQAIVLELDPADLLDAEPVSDERPFSRTRSRRAGAGVGESTEEDLALGAPEAVLEMCQPLSEAELAAWRSLIESRAETGERLLLLARRVENEIWLPLAILAFADRIRPGIAEAMAMALAAGIQPLVVTGDHPTTAAAIAEEAGLPSENVVTGPELESWDDARLAAELPRLNIVARAIPEQKLRIVDAARQAGRTVAVTGDGVNDAPALHHADVAVAMGSGTAVAREASDLILGDDSFVTLMHGLREGRRLVANVQKGLVFLISTHVAMLGFILIATDRGLQPALAADPDPLARGLHRHADRGFVRRRSRGARGDAAAAAASDPAAPRLGHHRPDLPRRRVLGVRRAGAHRAAQPRLHPRPMARLHRPGRRAGGSGEREPEPRLPGPAAPAQFAAARRRDPVRGHPDRHPVRPGPRRRVPGHPARRDRLAPGGRRRAAARARGRGLPVRAPPSLGRLKTGGR